MSQSRIAVMDAGNTRTKFGIFVCQSGQSVTAESITAYVNADLNLSTDTIEQWLDQLTPDRPRAAVIAGSNPEVRDWIIRLWPIPDVSLTVVDSFQQIPIGVDVEQPAAVGIDRLLTAFAANQLFAREQAAIIIDSGTATTVDLMTSDGVFRGGSILPGLRLSARALHEYTARLPLIETDRLGEQFSDGPPMPGRNTEKAITAGLFWGQLGAVKELSQRLEVVAKSKFAESKSTVHVLTGGGGRQLAENLPNAVYVDSLALYGLALLNNYETQPEFQP